MNKLLILYAKEEDKAELMELFEDLVERGLLLFFTSEKMRALEIATVEKPRLVLVDAIFEPLETGYPVVYMKRPFHKHHVIEKCVPYLDKTQLKSEEPLPM